MGIFGCLGVSYRSVALTSGSLETELKRPKLPGLLMPNAASLPSEPGEAAKRANSSYPARGRAPGAQNSLSQQTELTESRCRAKPSEHRRKCPQGRQPEAVHLPPRFTWRHVRHLQRAWYGLPSSLKAGSRRWRRKGTKEPGSLTASEVTSDSAHQGWCGDNTQRTCSILPGPPRNAAGSGSNQQQKGQRNKVTFHCVAYTPHRGGEPHNIVLKAIHTVVNVSVNLAPLQRQRWTWVLCLHAPGRVPWCFTNTGSPQI